ncbi:MAG: alanine racemase [Longimicrobiales bacterium]|nr:alanine racemase [Longimicrobiales bacterium]
MTPGGGPDFSDVDTPIGVLEIERVRTNADRVVEYASAHSLAWRPHIKTHKSKRVARIQLEAGARGLTVATLHEAEVMADLTPDLLLAYPQVGEPRIARIAALLRSTPVDLKVGIDSEPALAALEDAAGRAGRPLSALVELDVGLGRVGIPDAEDALRLARRISESDHVEFAGVLFYAGHIRGTGPEADRAMRALRDQLDDTLEAIERAGLAVEIVSGGTTPTLWRSHEIEALTEIRAGTCIFNDRDALACGAADPEHLAYSVLATVVSTAIEGRAAVDAGSKALAREERGGEGYGILLDRPEVTVVALSEEHGVLDLSGTPWRPRIGERVRIVPNHVCVSVNLQPAVLAVEDSTFERWELEGRGR